MKIDPAREEGFTPGIIPIRALDPRDERYRSYDITQLDKESLILWLAERPRAYVEDVLGIILGHGHLNPIPDEPST